MAGQSLLLRRWTTGQQLVRQIERRRTWPVSMSQMELGAGSSDDVVSTGSQALGSETPVSLPAV